MGHHGNSFLSFGSPSIGGWKEIARTTLGSPADDIDVTGLADKMYYMVLHSVLDTGGTINQALTLNNDSASNYARRFNVDGTGDTTQTSVANIGLNTTSAVDNFGITFLSNLSSEEKEALWNGTRTVSAGAGTAPDKNIQAWKWSNTADALNRIDSNNSGTGSYDTGSETVVLGWDPSDTHTDNFWEELASENASGSSTNLSSGTIAARKYLWVQAWVESTSAHVTNMTFNNDTTTYAYRNEDDGGADATSTSDSHIEIQQSSSTPVFCNMFVINNASNEKLVIGNTVLQNTAGAANAPHRRKFTAKYDNTSSQITEIDLDSSSGNWTTLSQIKVWGAD